MNKQKKVTLFLHIDEDGLKSSYDDITSTVDDIFTNEIQSPKHWLKKCVNHKDYVEK